MSSTQRLVVVADRRSAFTPDRQKDKKLIHIGTPDTTKLSCLCRIRVGGVNWIRDSSRLSPTENWKSGHVQSNGPIHTATPDTTQTRQFCRVWRGGVNWLFKV